MRARGTGLARAASGRLKIAQSSTPNVPLTSRSRRNPWASRHVAIPPNAGLCALAVAEHPPRHRVTGPHCCHTSVASPTRVQPPKHKIEYCTPNPNRHLVRGTEWGENDKISGYRQRGEPQSPAAPVADVARVRGAGPGQRARAGSGHTLLSFSPSESMAESGQTAAKRGAVDCAPRASATGHPGVVCAGPLPMDAVHALEVLALVPSSGVLRLVGRRMTPPGQSQHDRTRGATRAQRPAAMWGWGAMSEHAGQAAGAVPNP